MHLSSSTNSNVSAGGLLPLVPAAWPSSKESSQFYCLGQHWGQAMTFFHENLIRAKKVKPSSLSSTITMKFLVSTLPRVPQISGCHPEGDGSGCVPLSLSPSPPTTLSPTELKWLVQAGCWWTHDPCSLRMAAISRAVKIAMATKMLPAAQPKSATKSPESLRSYFRGAIKHNL